MALTNYGTAMCAFEDAARYANQRVQFGETIGRFQLIQEKFAHMAIKLNSMRNMLYETAWKSDNGLITSGDAAMCKYFCANAAFEVVDSAMQVLLVVWGSQVNTVLHVFGVIYALTVYLVALMKCRS